MENANGFISASAARYYWKGKGLCSVKTFANGNAWYNTGRGYYRVDDRSFLMLNNDTEYSIEINEQQPVSSFCLFFKRELLAELGCLLVRKPEFLVDNYNFLPDDYQFFERTLPLERLNTPSLHRFKTGFEAFKNDPFWIAENFTAIVYDLAGINSESLAERSRLPLKKSSTKQEVYKRVLIARDYLHYNFNQNVSLEEVAGISLLSLNHLLRCFKQAFGVTPHQYLITVRLQHAQQLLTGSDRPASQVCQEVGFESMGTFCNLFKRKTGLTPQQFRAKR